MQSLRTYLQRSSMFQFHVPLPILLGSYHTHFSSLGKVDMATVQKVEIKLSDEDKRRQQLAESKPPLSEILNLHDFEAGLSVYSYLLLRSYSAYMEAIARDVMQGKAWAYYSSAADDEIAVRENHAAYHR